MFQKEPPEIESHLRFVRKPTLLAAKNGLTYLRQCVGRLARLPVFYVDPRAENSQMYIRHFESSLSKEPFADVARSELGLGQLIEVTFETCAGQLPHHYTLAIRESLETPLESYPQIPLLSSVARP